MEYRTLGSLTVSALGFGCTGKSMAEFYGEGDDPEYIATIHAFLDEGGSLLDTADMYGPFTNEKPRRLGDRPPSLRRRNSWIASRNSRTRSSARLGSRPLHGYSRRECASPLLRVLRSRNGWRRTRAPSRSDFPPGPCAAR